MEKTRYLPQPPHTEAEAGSPRRAPQCWPETVTDGWNRQNVMFRAMSLNGAAATGTYSVRWCAGGRQQRIVPPRRGNGGAPRETAGVGVWRGARTPRDIGVAWHGLLVTVRNMGHVSAETADQSLFGSAGIVCHTELKRCLATDTCVAEACVHLPRQVCVVSPVTSSYVMSCLSKKPSSSWNQSHLA